MGPNSNQNEKSLLGKVSKIQGGGSFLGGGQGIFSIFRGSNNFQQFQGELRKYWQKMSEKWSSIALKSHSEGGSTKFFQQFLGVSTLFSYSKGVWITVAIFGAGICLVCVFQGGPGFRWCLKVFSTAYLSFFNWGSALYFFSKLKFLGYGLYFDDQ